MENYLIIQNNVVTNMCIWDGNPQTWQPPEGAITLVVETTPTKVWGLNEQETEFILVNSVGNAAIGFTWDGAYCTTNEPKPTVTPPSPQV